MLCRGGVNRNDKQEAIECIEEVLSAAINYDESLDYQLTSFDIDWLNKAKEALTKQIPKKPDYEGDGYDEDGNLIYDTWICPSCGKYYEVDYDDYDFCPECGQNIDCRLE